MCVFVYTNIYVAIHSAPGWGRRRSGSCRSAVRPVLALLTVERGDKCSAHTEPPIPACSMSAGQTNPACLQPTAICLLCVHLHLMWLCVCVCVCVCQRWRWCVEDCLYIINCLKQRHILCCLNAMSWQIKIKLDVRFTVSGVAQWFEIVLKVQDLWDFFCWAFEFESVL